MNNEPKGDSSASKRNTSPLKHLPQRPVTSIKTDASALPPPKQDADQKAPLIKQIAADQTPPKPAPVSKKGFSLKNSLPKDLKIARAFWMVASVSSMFMNVVLIIALGIAFQNIQNIRNSNTIIVKGLLGGLYNNFQKMDSAHITSNIPVETTIPVKFDLQLNQQTNVILSQDVTINNALVTVNTGGLNITRALTTIVLPQGTNLPVVLNLTVPVDTTVPVILNVPVDIPLAQTQLHDPFVGLQKVLEPYYCMLKPDATDVNDQLICK